MISYVSSWAASLHRLHRRSEIMCCYCSAASSIHTTDAGCRKPVKEFIDAIRAVTPKDISGLVSKMIKTPLSMASLGDIASVPRYNAVQSHFG